MPFLHSGRHFLQIPGPTNVPDRVLRAIDRPPSTIAGRSSPRSAARCSPACGASSRPRGPVVIYPASGTGAWEAALVNTLSPGDRVLMFETGHFATLWRDLARATRPRRRVRARRLAARRRRRAGRARSSRRIAARAIKAVCVVHNETSTGVTSDIPAIRARDRRAPGIRRCSSSTRSPRSARSTTGTTNGASTSPSAARRRA